MVRRSLAVLALALLAVPVTAQTDPIAVRKAMMKQNGKDTKAAVDMLKGDVPYDAAKAAAIFKSMNTVAKGFGAQFPASSKTGGMTEASPDIWAKPDAFKAAVAKFQADTAAAVAAKPATLEAFKPQFGAVTANCKSCHESFRIKAS